MQTPAGLQRYCPVCGAKTPDLTCPEDGTATVVKLDGFGKDALTYQVGDIVGGRYRIKGALGKGGFGAVYAAEHIGTRQAIAIKMLTLETSGPRGDSIVKRFYKEAQVTASLRHPNTVRVFDVGQSDEGPLYIAMEMLKGPSLEKVLVMLQKSGTTMTEAQAIDVAVPILRSLQEAHKAGLVHRDIKPANIMIVEGPDEEPLVKVLDFGIARAKESSLTAEGKALGTPAYMSTEQCRGRDLDGRSDLYAVGILLYECVTGQLPFRSSDVLALMYMHNHEMVPNPVPKASHPLSDEFVAIITKALEKDRDNRFASARDMRDALLGVRGGAWAGTPMHGVNEFETPAEGLRSGETEVAGQEVGAGANTLAALGLDFGGPATSGPNPEAAAPARMPAAKPDADAETAAFDSARVAHATTGAGAGLSPGASPTSASASGPGAPRPAKHASPPAKDSGSDAGGDGSSAVTGPRDTTWTGDAGTTPAAGAAAAAAAADKAGLRPRSSRAGLWLAVAAVAILVVGVGGYIAVDAAAEAEREAAAKALMAERIAEVERKGREQARVKKQQAAREAEAARAAVRAARGKEADAVFKRAKESTDPAVKLALAKQAASMLPENAAYGAFVAELEARRAQALRKQQEALRKKEADREAANRKRKATRRPAKNDDDFAPVFVE